MEIFHLIFNQYIESQLLAPFIKQLFSESIQASLLESSGLLDGLTNATCIFLFTMLIAVLTPLALYLKKCDSKSKQESSYICDRIVMLTNEIVNLKYENETLLNEWNDLETRFNSSSEQSDEQIHHMAELSNKYEKLQHEFESTNKELEKLKQNEQKLTKQLNQARLELNKLSENSSVEREELEIAYKELKTNSEQALIDLNSKYEQSVETINQQTMKLSEYEQHIGELKSKESELNSEILAQKETINMLQNSLLNQKESDEEISDYVNVEDGEEKKAVITYLMKIAQLQMDIKNLEDKLSESRTDMLIKIKEREEINERLLERDQLLAKSEQRQKN